MFGYQSAIFYDLAMDICKLIIRGEIKPGEKLPTVRDLAKEKKVNPNTVQKAYALLEEEKIVYAVERQGKFVTEELERIVKLKSELLYDLVEEFVSKCAEYDYSKEEVSKILKEKL